MDLGGRRHKILNISYIAAISIFLWFRHAKILSEPAIFVLHIGSY